MRPRLNSVSLSIAKFSTILLIGLSPFVLISHPVIAQAQTVQDRKAEADRLLEQGKKLIDGNQPQASLQPLQQALKVYQEIKDRSGQGQTLRQIGNAYTDLKDYEKTIAFQQQALAIAREINDRDLEARALNNIGLGYEGLKKINQGIAFYEQSLAVSRSSQNFKMIVFTSTNLANVYSRLKNYTKAIALLEEAILAAQKLPDRLEEARLFNEIGNKFYNAGNYAQAILAFQKGLVIAQDIKDKELIGEIFASIGDCYQKQEQFEKAIVAYQQALPFIRETKNQSLEEGVLRATGFSYLSQKKFDRAIEFYQQALLVVRKLGNPAKEWLALRDLGDAYFLKGEQQKAILFHQEALEIAQTRWKDRASEARNLETLGMAYSVLKEFQKASELLERGLAIYKELKDKPSQVRALPSLMSAHNSIAFSLYRKNNSQAIEQSNLVIQLAPAAINLARELGDLASEKRIKENESNAYTAIGRIYTDTTELSRAEEFIQKGLKIARESGNLMSERTALTMLTGVYVARGEYYKNDLLYERMLELSRKLQLPYMEVLDILALAQNYADYGEIQKAIQVAQQAQQKVGQIDPTTISTERQSSFRTAIFYSLLNLSSYHMAIADYEQALATAQQNIQFARTVPEAGLKVQALIKLGEVQSARQNQPAALEAFQQALAIAQSANLVSDETDALIKLSAAWLSQGNNAKALETAQRAIVVAQKGVTANQENLRLQQKAQSALISVYTVQGEYAKILNLLETGIERDKQLANPILQITGSRYQLGAFYLGLGDYPKANEQFQQMLTKAQSIKYPLLEALSWQLLAQTAWSQQSPQKALEFAQKGSTVARQNQMVSLEMAVNGILAVVYGELRDEQKAMSAAQGCLEIARRLKDSTTEKGALTLIASLNYRFGHKDAALTAFESALAILPTSTPDNTTSNVSGGDALIYAGLARIYADRNQPEIAIAFYKKAVVGIQNTRKNIQTLSPDLQKSFLQTTIDFGGTKTVDIYRNLADLLLKRDRILEAQQVLDLLKIQELDDYLRNVRGGQQTLYELPPEQAILKKYNALNQSAIALGQELNELQQLARTGKALTPTQEKRKTELLDLQTDLTKQFNEFAQQPEIVALLKQLTPTEVDVTIPLRDFAGFGKKMAELNAVMLYPLVLDDRLELIITAPNAQPLRRTVNVTRQELNQTIQAFRAALQDPSQDAKPIAQKLYTWLIKPLEADLKAAKPSTIVYAPDGQLRYIPLAALYDGQQWLVQKYRINNITSKSIDDLTTQSQGKPRVLAGAFGTTDQQVFFAGQTFSFRGLAFANKEVDSLAKLVPGTTELLGQAFTPKATTNVMNEYTIVHLATHASLVPEAANSFIVFGNGTATSLTDIQNWTLDNVDLIVLSACETGLGGKFGKNGEEVLGLGYQFTKPGKAKAAIASLWQVDDGGTQILMDAFYSILQNQKTTKTEALRQAQIALITGDYKPIGGQRAGLKIPDLIRATLPQTVSDRLNHPYYWAPFILIGNGL